MPAVPPWTPTVLAIVMPPIIPATAAVTFRRRDFRQDNRADAKERPVGNPETSRPSASMA